MEKKRFLYMDKNVIKLFCILLFSCLFISCNEHSESIFEDMFINISEDPFAYKNNDAFDFEEITKNDSDFPSYASMYNCEKIYKIKNSSMIITYWNVAGKNQIQTILINDKITKHPFSKFIGKKADNVLKQYPKNKTYELTKSELKFDSEDWLSFIQFKIKDEIIYQIVIGKNL